MGSNLSFHEVMNLPLRDVLSRAGARSRQSEAKKSRGERAQPPTVFIATRGDDNGRPLVSDPVVFLSEREATVYANHHDALLVVVHWDKADGQYGIGSVIRFRTWQRGARLGAKRKPVARKPKPKATKSKSESKNKKKTRRGAG